VEDEFKSQIWAPDGGYYVLRNEDGVFGFIIVRCWTGHDGPNTPHEPLLVLSVLSGKTEEWESCGGPGGVRNLTDCPS